MTPPLLAVIHLANHRLNLRSRVVGHGFVSADYIKMAEPTVTSSGKIIPAAVETPSEATPPPSTMPGGPIEAAAAKTEAAANEVNSAATVLANPGGMSGGGEVEVHVPGPKMPSGGDGPSFASNYTAAIETLDTLKNNAGGDSLVTAGPEQVNPASQGGGGELPAEAGDMGASPPLYAGGLRRPHSRFHSAELAKGVKMEMEHTKDPRIALEIAKDHLMELPDYYTRLEAMLKKAVAKHYKKKGGKTKRNGRGDKRTHRRV